MNTESDDDLLISFHTHAILRNCKFSVQIFLAEHCNFIAMPGYCHVVVRLSSVCLSSVTRGYCDKKTEVRIM